MSDARGSIIEKEFNSVKLQETIHLLIYLPAYYSPMKKYPVLFVNDGKDYFQLGRLPRYMDALIDNSEIESAIIIGIPYKNVSDRRNKYHPEGKQYEQYKQFLVHELIPWVDEEYSTLTFPSNRTIVGDSLAATISLLSALDYPQTFGQLILHSPYINDVVLEKVEKYNDDQMLNIYHVIGSEENNVEVSDIKDFLTPNRKLSQLFKRKGFTAFYEEFTGGHSWKYWQPDVKRALVHMLS